MSIITALHSMNVIPSLISRTVSVDVKYHVYFLTYDERCWVGSPVSACACVRVCGCVRACACERQDYVTGSLLSGHLRDVTGAYHVSFYFMSGSGLLSAAVLMLTLLLPTKEKKAQDEEKTLNRHKIQLNHRRLSNQAFSRNTEADG